MRSTRQMRKQVVALEDHADVAVQGAERRAATADMAAVDDDLARIDRLQAVDAPEKRALAGAGPADDGDDLALLDVEIDAVEDDVAAVALRDVA